MRAFVAIPLPDYVRAVVAKYAAATGLPGARPVAAENLHVTVHFLGSVADASAPDLVAALGPACAGVPAFALRVRGAELAPRQRPRMVWAALDAPDAYARLVEEVAAAAVPFAPDARAPRPGRPHVTLARLHRPPRRGTELPPLPSTPAFPVEGCVLLRSQLGRGGASYERLADLPLAPAGPFTGG